MVDENSTSHMLIAIFSDILIKDTFGFR